MNRYFVREGETESCPALKVHVLSFAFLPPRPTLSLFAVPQIPWVNIVPTKKASQAQDGKFEFLCLFIAVER